MDDEQFLEFLRNTCVRDSSTPPENDPTPPPPPPPNLGFAPYATTPGVMGFSPAGFQQDSPPVFAQFQTPPSKGSRGATQHLEGLNLSSSFESVSNVPANTKKKGKGKKPVAASEEESDKTKPVQYSEDESEHLAVVWASISQDPIIGDAQKEKIYWGKIVARYNTTIGTRGPTRNKKQLKGHWQRIVPKINLFHGYYTQCNRDRQSGDDDKGVYVKAEALYRESTGVPFKYQKAWSQLALLPKYKQLFARKKQKGVDGSSNSSNPDDDSDELLDRSRPIGTKQAKAAARDKGKAKQSEETIDLDTVPEGAELEFLQTNTLAASKYMSLVDKKQDVLDMKKQAYRSKIIQRLSNVLATDTSNMTPDALEKHQFLVAQMMSMIEK